jgi:hypothetical protein
MTETSVQVESVDQTADNRKGEEKRLRIEFCSGSKGALREHT